MNKIKSGYPAVILAMVLVGSTVVAGKLVSASFPVFFAGGIRYGLATLVLLPLVVRGSGGKLKMGKPVLLLLVTQVFFGQFLFTILLLTGLRLTGGTEAGIISGTTPAMIGLLSFLFLNLMVAKTLDVARAITAAIQPVVIGGARSKLPFKNLQL